ncbi:hypothetical protein C1H46_004253 [Malus baccata]|uniref:Uncharacterized protein n=1 Tax=Malus baccata TaxID=106549 RepID=A0A540NI11_MALBA|nr:hypothetical protein C1H46_004253 [Malus baccata]
MSQPQDLNLGDAHNEVLLFPPLRQREEDDSANWNWSLELTFFFRGERKGNIWPTEECDDDSDCIEINALEEIGELSGLVNPDPDLTAFVALCALEGSLGLEAVTWAWIASF